jgi:hypothetical protein
MNSRFPLGPGICWDQLQEAPIDHVDKHCDQNMQIGSENVFLRVASEGPEHSASGIRRFYMYSSRTAAPLGSEITETGRHNRSHPLDRLSLLIRFYCILSPTTGVLLSDTSSIDITGSIQYGRRSFQLPTGDHHVSLPSLALACTERA